MFASNLSQIFSTTTKQIKKKKENNKHHIKNLVFNNVKQCFIFYLDFFLISFICLVFIFIIL